MKYNIEKERCWKTVFLLKNNHLKATMKILNVTLAYNEIETIITALLPLPFNKVNRLIHYLDKSLLESIQQDKPTEPTPLEEMKPNPPQAPYGIKKDGTPAKRRGRAPAKRRGRPSSQV